MTAEYVCMRCTYRDAGRHDCNDRACYCCSGEPEVSDEFKAQVAEFREANDELLRRMAQ
jgi:hypothetical protein